MKKLQLRYAIICDDRTDEKWLNEVITKLSELNKVVLSACMNIPGKKRVTNPRLLKFTSKTGSYKNKVYNIVCEGKMQNDNFRISKKNICLIKRLNLDFLICFSKSPIDGDLLTLTKYGVWKFDIGNNKHAFSWDYNREDPVTSVSLKKLLPDSKHILLKQGYFSTVKKSNSQNQLFLKTASASYPALVCRDILNENAVYFSNNPIDNEKVIEGKVKKDNFLLKWVENKLHQIYTKLFCYEYWNVGIVQRPITSFLTEDEKEMDIQWLVDRKDMYLADPFVYKKEDKLQIIMEELDYKVVKGFISEAVVSEDEGKVQFHQATINSASHMSYPYILEHDGEIYCIPETSEAREVSIYKLRNKAGQWQKVKAILNGFPAVDSTIINYEDLWWLFCTKANSNSQSHNNELYLFYSDDLFGEWQSHISNPVKVDIRSSRPAGTPFIYEGAIYRPAQDCSVTYGGRIALNKIISLTPTKFEEETVKYVEPNKFSMYPDGLHTISSAGEVTIIDGKRFDYHWSHFFRKLYKIKPTSFQKIRTPAYDLNNALWKTGKTYSGK